MIEPPRFPPPWSVEEQDACFVVRDHDGEQLAYASMVLATPNNTSASSP